MTFVTELLLFTFLIHNCQICSCLASCVHKPYAYFHFQKLIMKQLKVFFFCFVVFLFGHVAKIYSSFPHLNYSQVREKKIHVHCMHFTINSNPSVPSAN